MPKSAKRSFKTILGKNAAGRVVVAVPFDPDAAWGTKPRHHVSGTIGGGKWRGPLAGGVITLGPAWLRDCHVGAGDAVEVVLWPEGPQQDELAKDVAVALAASPTAAAFFNSLATFYRKGYLRWVDATKRRPEVRAERIAEMVKLLQAGKKERPR